MKHLDASWHLEHGIEQGDEVVIEWTMLWRDPRHGNEQRIDRGTEWFVVRDGLIAEVRAYHHSDAQEPRRATCSASTTKAAVTRRSSSGTRCASATAPGPTPRTGCAP